MERCWVEEGRTRRRIFYGTGEEYDGQADLEWIERQRVVLMAEDTWEGGEDHS